jgi:hypothetical protein
METYRKEIKRFYGTNYSTWKSQMECHLRCIGEMYWEITKNAYKIPKGGPSTLDEIKDVEYNTRAMEAFLSDLNDTKMTNFMDLKTTHEI